LAVANHEEVLAYLDTKLAENSPPSGELVNSKAKDGEFAFDIPGGAPTYAESLHFAGVVLITVPALGLLSA
jgi:hypothetical protein